MVTELVRKVCRCPPLPLKISLRLDGEQEGKREHGKLSSEKVVLKKEKREHETAGDIQ